MYLFLPIINIGIANLSKGEFRLVVMSTIGVFISKHISEILASYINTLLFLPYTFFSLLLRRICSKHVFIFSK